MGLGRRTVSPEQAERWIYNRMADAYSARPAYPAALIEHVLQLLTLTPAAVVDIGAGIGHLSVPLAKAGHHVHAVEPAQLMLGALAARAAAERVQLELVHAAAEELPLPAASADLLLVADAVHFLAAKRAGQEFDRVLRRPGVLAFVQVEFGASRFMQALAQLMREAAPRRPKAVSGVMTEIAALCGITLALQTSLESVCEVDGAQLETILRSISFIGPAMSAARFDAFRERVQAIVEPPVWHTTLHLYAGRRK
ncbi:MAG: hypothetical protein RL701_2929 [Pseudomonadota bacterium]|jgi:ubiquinone/menaquinone biosynthesis C-methylase UbiE